MDGQILSQKLNYEVEEKVASLLSQEKHEAVAPILGDHEVNDEEVDYYQKDQ